MSCTYKKQTNGFVEFAPTSIGLEDTELIILDVQKEKQGPVEHKNKVKFNKLDESQMQLIDVDIDIQQQGVLSLVEQNILLKEQNEKKANISLPNKPVDRIKQETSMNGFSPKIPQQIQNNQQQIKRISDVEKPITIQVEQKN